MFLFMLLIMFLMSVPSYNPMTHPLFLCLLLLLMNMLVNLNMNVPMQISWFPYIIFMVITGGLMILFLYFVTFLNNMKMSLDYNQISMIPVKTVFLMIFFYLMIYQYQFNFDWMLSLMDSATLCDLLKFNDFKESMRLSYIYMKNKVYTTLFTMFYLFLILTLIVKLCITQKFMMRKIN